jgi:SAM-dependent methyltransferase
MPEFDIRYPHAQVQRVVPKGFRTIHNRMVAFKLGKEYYDGARQNGYGGFRYDGRWKLLVPALIEKYSLTGKSKVLDIGCKKGFFLHDLKSVLPTITVRGVENHPYPLETAMESVRADLIMAPYQDLPFLDHSFDFVMAFAAIYMLNLRDVMAALREIQRVGKGNSYVTVGAYRTQEERDLFLEWTVLGTTVLHVDEWLEVFRECGYTGDYYFTTAASLRLAREEEGK